MRIALFLADTEPVAFTEVLTLPEGVGGEDAVSFAPVRLTGKLTKSGTGYTVRGSVAGDGRLRCVRCLAEFAFSFEEDFSVRLLPGKLAPNEDELQLSRKDLDVRFYTEAVLDLVELAAEQVELLLPMKPLCREDCRGLCPRCGADRNLGDCGCPKEVDERWEALAHFHPVQDP